MKRLCVDDHLREAHVLPNEIWELIISLLGSGKVLKTSGAYNERLVLSTVSRLWHSLILKHTKICQSLVTRVTPGHLWRLKSVHILNRDDKYINDNFLMGMSHLKTLSIVSNSHITGESLTTLTQLKSLSIGLNSMITAGDMTRMTNLTNLSLYQQHEYMEYMHIGNDALKSLTNLRSLSIDANKKVTDVLFDHLTGLEVLVICNCENLTPGALNKLHSIKELSLKCVLNWNINYWPGSLTSITKLTLRFIPGMADSVLQCLTNITHLNVSKCTGITNLSISTLLYIKKLEIFDMGHIGDNAIKGLTNLESLYVKSPMPLITSNSVSCLIQLKELIIIVGRNITDAGLTTLTNLTRLKLISSPIKGCGIVSNRLKRLYLGTNSFFSEYELGRLTSLKKLAVYGGPPSITADGVSRLTWLKTLKMYDGTLRKRDSSIGGWEKCIKNMSSLKRLFLKCASKIDITDVEHLTNLERIGIRNDKGYDINREEFISYLKSREY